MNILIPNVTGPTNIGDQAILLPAIELLKRNFPNAQITIHTTNPDLYKKRIVDTIDSHLYNWAVFEDKNSFTRIQRLMELLIAYSSIRLGYPLVARGKLKKLVEDYLSADMIVFIGGGYLRSKTKFSQSLNLIMISSLFHFAKLTRAVKIVLPLSFGPFAYTWQERFAADTLRGFDLISARESFSFRALKKRKVSKIIRSNDTALLLDVKTKEKNKQDFILGFTIRNWLDEQRQNIFEQNVIGAIIEFSRETKSIVQPILQVVGDQYGESDQLITERIVQALKRNNIKVRKTYKILTLEDSCIYSEIDMLVGMRMHSNILAAVHGSPFVALSYEHKTEGIARDLGMQDYVLNCEKVTSQNLYALLIKTYKNRRQLTKIIGKSLEDIKSIETNRWNNIFQTL